MTRYRRRDRKDLLLTKTHAVCCIKSKAMRESGSASRLFTLTTISATRFRLRSSPCHQTYIIIIRHSGLPARLWRHCWIGCKQVFVLLLGTNIGKSRTKYMVEGWWWREKMNGHKLWLNNCIIQLSIYYFSWFLFLIYLCLRGETEYPSKQRTVLYK